MNRRLGTLALAAFAVAGIGLAAGIARADQPPLKIGFITSYSGSTAAASRVADAAINTWIAQHGDTVAGRKVVVIRRDDTGAAPETARRLAQELVIGDKVDFLAGIIYSPNAVAVGQVSAQSKTPFLVMNATQSKLTYGDPYMARFSLTLPQLSAPLAKWALQNGIKSVFAIYLDYAPGLDAAAGFSQAFTAGGGTLVGDLKVPLQNPDFSGYVQRIKDAKPQAVFAFVNANGGGQPFLKAFYDAGLAQAGVKILATPDLVLEAFLPTYGDMADGIISTGNYSANHDSKLNAAFVSAVLKADNGESPPDYNSVAIYDIMHAIYTVTEQQKGSLDPDRTMQLLRGLAFESPRGPLEIGRDSRDIVQTVYIRRTE
ncbi:MAG TPA: ABC transporter substrate-binding protein, partial [Candidatus Lustribacter sp.]|nr:ABC transporter substrate-binding protein [Candidatus Lustribacter sp.]